LTDCRLVVKRGYGQNIRIDAAAQFHQVMRMLAFSFFKRQNLAWARRLFPSLSEVAGLIVLVHSSVETGAGIEDE
jgi:hypothetical protein